MLLCNLFIPWAVAQTPKWVSKARKAVFSIVTYDGENQLKGNGNGFYIDNEGTALSDYTLFDGAQRAVIITTDGKQQDIQLISGTDAMYDVIKFKTAVGKKQMSLPIAALPAKEGDLVYLLPYATQKSDESPVAKVLKVDSIGNKSVYYTLDIKTNEKMVSCPIMNANGEVLGMIQKSASDEEKESYALGVSYGVALSINPLSMNDASLQRIGIKKALPDTQDQALIYILMASSKMNTEEYGVILNDFVVQFPESSEGFMRRSSFYMSSGKKENFELADKDMEQALSVSKQKDETLFSISKTLYNYALGALNNQEANPAWNMEAALGKIQEAVKINPLPQYTQMEGDIYFAMKNYAEAYKCYDAVNRSEIATAATYYSAAKAKDLCEDSKPEEVIALLDSALNFYVKPYTKEAGPYFYERANVKARAKMYREAVIDYNQFYDIFNGNVTAQFLFERQQSEIQCKMYQQALNDINKAAELEPENASIWVEKGSVHLRINQLEEAEKALMKGVELNDKDAGAYRMLGYCQAEMKKKKEALENLNKAKELGDEVAPKLLKKYFNK